MIRTKLGLLGLCTVALGLMAFSADAAQATFGSKWLVLTSGGVLKEGSALHALLQLEKDSPSIVLHSEILKIKVLFLCTAVKAINALLQKEGTIAKEYNAEGKPVGLQVLFSGCTTDLNGVAAPECTPNDPSEGIAGTIVTKLAHALLDLHKLPSGEVDDIVKILPDVGETFATIALPPVCPIGTSVPIIGKLTLKDCENLFLTHLVKHLWEPGPLSELWAISKTAEHAATLLGSVWAFLVGEHLGLKFSGDPF